MSDKNNSYTQTQPMGYGGKLDHSKMVSYLFHKLLYLHSENQDKRARDLFYNTLSWFTSDFDRIFINNCVKIEENVDKLEDMTSMQKLETIYRLQLAEFSRLMVRAGYTPKPDIMLVYQPTWEVPKDLDELFDRNSKEGVEDAESSD